MTSRPLAPLAAVLCLALATSASAQTDSTGSEASLHDEMADCAKLELDSQRLECFDGLSLRMKQDAAPAAMPQAEAMHSFSGKDDWDSEVFKVEEPWQVAWETEASILTVELQTQEGELVDVIGQQIGSGKGRSKTLKPGTYKLGMRGLGDSRIQVVAEP